MMPAPHIPVLLEETIRLLDPAPGKRIVDGTYGFGGHSKVLLGKGAEVLGLDLDGEAVEACEEVRAKWPCLQCRNVSFRYLDTHLADLGWSAVDGLLLDLGVSSRQLDDPDKGFSYRADGPLDLRFDRSAGQPAHMLLQNLAEADLARLIWEFGEERASRRLARAIVKARAEEPIRTTGRLRDVVTRSLPKSQKLAPTLSRLFQALRIAVNAELEALADVLALVPVCLAPAGRVVIISYHSLEDRLVKQWLDTESRDCICPPDAPACCCGHVRSLRVLTRKAVQSSRLERQENKRSRSARLRAAELL